MAENHSNSTRTDPSAEVPASVVALMAVSVGLIVANIYYIQPLLAYIARDFRVSVPVVGSVATMTQLGTALGMLLFVPLGDTKERRGLVAVLLLFCSAALALVGAAQNLGWLAVASMAVGLSGATVHIIVPYAAQLAAPHQRGRVVGTVLSGLLFGILLARTFSGILGDLLGWRAVFFVASGLMLLLAGLIFLKLPRSVPSLTLTWPQLVASTLDLVKTQPVLREAAFISSTFFCAFSAFWTTLVFRLQAPPFHYGSTAAGLFGLVGAAGALAAPFVGHMAGQGGARRNVLFALCATSAAFLLMMALGNHLWGLILGVLLLDVGVQSGHVTNQTRIYGLVPEARGRLNMFYMICYFLGGAVGSEGASLAWHRFGWTGVCLFALLALLCGGVTYALTAWRYGATADSAASGGDEFPAADAVIAH